jgi:hypothetical protein
MKRPAFLLAIGGQAAEPEREDRRLRVGSNRRTLGRKGDGGPDRRARSDRGRSQPEGGSEPVRPVEAEV